MKNLIKASITVLIISALIYKFVDFRQYNDFILRASVNIQIFIMDADIFLRSIHIKGVYRCLEGGLGKISYYMTDHTNLTIEWKLFSGVNVLLFSPVKRDTKGPAIVYYHGGGWAIMNPELYSPFLANLARRLNTMIVAVDYKKAPEYPFPAPFNDAVTATKYFLINSKKFDVDPNRIALMGDSAGGSLVVSVGYHLAAMKRTNKIVHSPKVLVSLNPVLQFVDLSTPSYRDNLHDPLLVKARMARYYCVYAFGHLSWSELTNCIEAMITHRHLTTRIIQKVRDRVDWSNLLSGRGYDNRPRSSFAQSENQFTEKLSELVESVGFSPLSALNDTQLQILPPVYVYGSSKDPLRDDAKMLVARLKKLRSFGDYREFQCFHVCFLLTRIDVKDGETSLKELISLFENNAIL